MSVIEQLLFALVMLALLALPFYWNRVLDLAAIARRSGGRLTDGELGLAEIQLQPGWKGTAIPDSPASIQAADRLRRRFLVITSESREDFSSDMDLAQFSQVTFGQLCGSARLVEVQGPERCTLGGFDALQIEAVMIVADRYVTKYLHSAVSGLRGFHQVIVWSAPSTYDRALFDRLLEGFRERPGPVPNVVPPSGTSSGYVH